MFDLITNSMIFLLESLKAIVGNYGWAIILLTVLVRLALWPVSQSQMRSMKMMQDLQPKMKQLQERYKADPQKLQAEMFKLYKDYKFNPLGGCLPMLVQLPLFIGLYWAISSPQLMMAGDPTFLNFIHLKHTGIITHGGPSEDGRMSLNPQEGGFFGVGKDRLMAGQTMTVHLTNGTNLDLKVPDPNKALTFTPENPRPGVPVRITADFTQLGLSGYDGLVKTVDLTVVNSATQEREQFSLTPVGKNLNRIRTTMDTVPGKTLFNVDVMLLVVIFAATMIVSQKMMSSQATAGNEQQQQMMKFLPIMFSVFLFIFPIPAGVLLYMATNSIFQIIQTWMFQRKSESGDAKTPPSQSIIDIKPDRPKA